MKNKTVLAKNSIALIGLALVFAAAGLLHHFGGQDLSQPGEVSVDTEGSHSGDVGAPPSTSFFSD